MSEYSEVPAGCSPLMIVVCSSWENAEFVHGFCCHLMKKVPVFIAVLQNEMLITKLICPRISVPVFSRMLLIDL